MVVVLWCEAIPQICIPSTSASLLRFVLSLSAPEQLEAESDLVLRQNLPGICPALLRALATLEHFGEPEMISLAGEVLIAIARALPGELECSLLLGLEEAEVPSWSRDPFLQHAASHASWPKSDWLDHLAEIIREWQSDHRHQLTRD
jgi:hypothetical protein